MATESYHIQLKGYVGGTDFDRKEVDNVLAENADQQVNVLIDSLGGSLATGISISAAFKNHGNVNVHFVGLNASAATIASLGAAHISIDAGAMYLVHKCSMEFFEWGCLNADQFATLITDCEKVKADLDKLDKNCAQLYAARCKRKPEELLDLMKAGGWLTAKEALDWGFVDEVTDLEEDAAAEMTDALASAMAAHDIPIPNIPVAEFDRQSAFAKLIAAISSLFVHKSNVGLNSGKEDKAYTAEQYDAMSSKLDELNNTIAERDKVIAERDARIADLEEKLAKTPAAGSTNVIEASKTDRSEISDAQRFVETYNSARVLFNLV